MYRTVMSMQPISENYFSSHSSGETVSIKGIMCNIVHTVNMDNIVVEIILQKP